MTKELIWPRKRADKTNILVELLVITVALTLVASFAGMAFASMNMKGHEGFVKGEIVAVDMSHKTPTITLNEANKMSPVNPNNELNIFLTSGTHLKICKTKEPLKDIKVGEKVSVSYHELSGLAVADRITSPC
jgi:hypothetical protein